MHTIRLRGPWEVSPQQRFLAQADGTYLPSADDLPLPARVKMPADWGEQLGADFVGRVRYRRTFQKPTGLDAGERVFLVIEPPTTHGAAFLNDRTLGEVVSGGPHLRIEITARLEDHNRLEIVVTHPALDAAPAAAQDGSTTPVGGLVGEVRLEIED